MIVRVRVTKGRSGVKQVIGTGKGCRDQMNRCTGVLTSTNGLNGKGVQ